LPVTARLSRAFYDRLGDDIANELVNWFNAVDATYRDDLRQVNELNFARFDARLEQRLAELRAELEMRIAALDRRFDSLEARFDGLEARQEDRAAALECRLEKRMDVGFAEVRAAIAATRADVLRWMFVLVTTAVLAILGLK
jgi:hypothetical protein